MKKESGEILLERIAHPFSDLYGIGQSVLHSKVVGCTMILIEEKKNQGKPKNHRKNNKNIFPSKVLNDRQRLSTLWLAAVDNLNKRRFDEIHTEY